MIADTKAVRIAKLAKQIAFRDVVYNLKAAQQCATPLGIHTHLERARQAKQRYWSIRNSMAF